MVRDVRAVEDGVFVVLDTDKQFAQQRREHECDYWNCDGGDGDPEYEGVPLPLPELVDEVERVLASGMDQLTGRKGNGRGVEDVSCDVDEGNDEE